MTDLTGRFDLKPYPTPHSDLMALMVLEHQVGTHNRLAGQALEGRIALHRNDETTARTVRELGDELVDYLLFRGEAPLTDAVQGTSTFAADFRSRGAVRLEGADAREFDLKTRLFKHPCSYLIYSDAFPEVACRHQGLHAPRLYAILRGGGPRGVRPPDGRRPAGDPGILAETLPDAAGYWEVAAGA